MHTPTTIEEALSMLAAYRAGKGPSGKGDLWNEACHMKRSVALSKRIAKYTADE
jgi:hypothetical protein